MLVNGRVRDVESDAGGIEVGSGGGGKVKRTLRKELEQRETCKMYDHGAGKPGAGRLELVT